MPLTPPPPATQAHIKRGVVIVAGLLIALILGGLFALTHWVSLPTFSAPPKEDPPKAAPLGLPEMLTKPPGPSKPVPEVPLAREITPPAGASQQAAAVPLPDALKPPTPPVPGQTPATDVRRMPAQTPLTPARVPPTPPAPKPVKKWLFLQPTALGGGTQAGKEQNLAQDVKDATTKLAKASLGGGAEGLIKPAVWARPLHPELTLYRSMFLPGRLLDNLNSDIPATTIRIEMTVPIFDKLTGQKLLLDKGSLLIASQGGKIEFGQKLIPLKLEQIELVSGAVLDLKATVGDQSTSAGLHGTVNNHIGGLLLATGINAVLQLGLGTAVGTPSGFQANPGQQAAREAGQSVAGDINSVTRQQLRVPPTIEASAGAIVQVALQENVQFNRRPYVAK